MTRKTLSALFALLLTLALVLSACGNSGGGASPTPGATPSHEATPDVTPDATPEATPDAPADTAITVIDQTGNTVRLDAPAQKVVALTPAMNEIIYALGSFDILVGRGEYCDYPAEVFNIPSVGTGTDTNIEQIIALDPDLVVMATMAQTTEQVDQLVNAGIAVYSSDAASIAETYESIEQIGALIGKSAEADELVASMKASFEELSKEKLSGTLYFEISPLEWGLWTAGQGSFMNEVADIIGLTNIFSDVGAWAEISEEQVIERNPDYIMTITMYFGEGPTPVDEILSRAAWKDITAVKNNAILNLPDNELSRPGPRLVDGAKALYDFVKNAGQ
ncbi:MAG: ABC transporter substrate-binding protein [Oscillospiraceae bacterium]|jgi:iron complex transport system substrate-binding protein|nr:ABC transporter substrate-binding protein [Oscillospiraceae bacterium]